MLTIDIYKDNTKIETKSFEDEFYIMQNDNGLWWETGAEQEERATARGKKLKELVRKFKGGTIVIWIRVRPAPYPADIKSIGPDWRLTIDGVVMESGIHSNLYVSGKTIELENGGYRFVCSFPPSQKGPKSMSQPYDFTPV